jgi:hypothetical protein
MIQKGKDYQKAIFPKLQRTEVFFQFKIKDFGNQKVKLQQILSVQHCQISVKLARQS